MKMTKAATVDGTPHLQTYVALDVREVSLVDSGAVEEPFYAVKALDRTEEKIMDPKTSAAARAQSRSFETTQKLHTGIAKSVELFDFSIDDYRANICEAVRKAGGFGEAADPNWDLWVQDVFDGEIVVRNYEKNKLFRATMKTTNGVDFEFGEAEEVFFKTVYVSRPDADFMVAEKGSDLSATLDLIEGAIKSLEGAELSDEQTARLAAIRKSEATEDEATEDDGAEGEGAEGEGDDAGAADDSSDAGGEAEAEAEAADEVVEPAAAEKSSASSDVILAAIEKQLSPVLEQIAKATQGIEATSALVTKAADDIAILADRVEKLEASPNEPAGASDDGVESAEIQKSIWDGALNVKKRRSAIAAR
jgi:hypothetical protein